MDKHDSSQKARGALLVGFAVAALGGLGASAFSQVTSYETTLLNRTLKEAEHYNQALKSFRTLYTKEVVVPTKKYGIVARHDYRHHPSSIPLPATLTAELGSLMASESSDVSIRLYSDFPFPWRKKSLDDFEQRALDALRKQSNAPYYELVESRQGRRLRYATADVMREACIGCHNSHADSPKTDWKVGDVRGVLASSMPLGSGEAAGAGRSNQTPLLVSALSILMLLVFSLKKPTKAP